MNSRQRRTARRKRPAARPTSTGLHLHVHRGDDVTVLLYNTVTGEFHAGTNHPFCGLSLVDVTPEQVQAATTVRELLRGPQYDGGTLDAYREPEYRVLDLRSAQQHARP